MAQILRLRQKASTEKSPKIVGHLIRFETGQEIIVPIGQSMPPGIRGGTCFPLYVGTNFLFKEEK